MHIETLLTDHPIVVDKRKLLFFNVIPLPHSIDLQEGLVESGFEVDFWYLRDNTSIYPWKTLEKKIGYKIFRSEYVALLASAEKSDLVIITGWHSVAHVILALYCWLRTIRFAFWLDVPLPPKRGIRKSVKRWLLHTAHRLFITGETGIDFFCEYYDIDPAMCSDFPYLEKKIVQEEIERVTKQRTKALAEGGKIRILLSNRFLPRKGYRTVYNALSRLSDEVLSKIEISILGVGAEFEIYNKEFKSINTSIQMKGWVEYGDYLELLKQTDVFVHASIHEPYGIPPIDAMAMGKLVIASHGVMSCNDRIKTTQNGFLFQADDYVDLKDILESIVYNQQMIYRIGEQARLTSCHYGIEYNIKTINQTITN
jgi:glycosyltransferase involved in cell wall biosynthesis